MCHAQGRPIDPYGNRYETAGGSIYANKQHNWFCRPYRWVAFYHNR
ncbi:MAG: hypothetical protein ACTSP9_18965 [Promethearchaeota archaeon]